MLLHLHGRVPESEVRIVIQCCLFSTETMKFIRDGNPGRPHIVHELSSRGVHWSQLVPNMSTDIRGH